MGGKLYPNDVLDQARTASVAWKQIDPELAIGELTCAALEAQLGQVDPLVSQLTALETQMTNLRNQRDALYGAIWDKVKRVKNGVKAIYGDDSSQYEMVGDTRRSERKTSARKTAAA
jgi:CRISPR/Cas system-associated protein Cas7 (RAMP superfamily)